MTSQPTAFKERIDMALFGPLPDFIRISIRLKSDPASPIHGRGARSASVLLSRLSRDSVSDERVAEVAFDLWRRAYAVVGLPEATVPPPEALRAWALLQGGIPSQGVVEDVINAFALENQVPAAAYDLAPISGDLWLRPSRGHESFEAADGRSITPTINEFILADSSDRVLAMAWHGQQSAPTRIGPGSDNMLIHVDLLDVAPAAARRMAESLAARLTGFVGGTAKLRILSREEPMVSWPA